MPGFDRTFATKKLVLCDLDGTIYLGNRLLPGAREFLAFLERKNIPFYFLSNNSSRSKRDYAEKLSNLGIETSEEKILLSTDGVIAFLKDKNIRDLYVV
ncbi:MAG: TIGR01457 family HAD-type hydrolase, partial [Candidatus Aminicenantales bacterium]